MSRVVNNYLVVPAYSFCAFCEILRAYWLSRVRSWPIAYDFMRLWLSFSAIHFPFLTN